MKKKSFLFLGLVAVLSQACAVEDDMPTGDELDVDSADSGGKADGPGADNYTFYTARQDFRRCASPMCGGKWVSRVNRANLKCADGTTAKECYVAEIDWSSLGLPESQLDGARDALNPLFRGSLQTRDFGEVGKFGVLQPTEIWAANNEAPSDGVFVRVTDSGIRCITTPCNSLHEGKLNAGLGADIAELDFSWSDATEDEISKAYEAVASDDGLLVVGYRYFYRDNGSWAKGRDVSQFWRRVVAVDDSGSLQAGDTCGGRTPGSCDDGLFCAFEAAAICGFADATGTCAVKPEACIQLYQPVCGCDGLTHGNSCMAANAGTSVQYDGECASTPPS